MRKILAMLAIAVFIGGISTPSIASTNNNQTVIALHEDEPKKEKKTEKSKEAARSEKDCEGAKKCCSKSCGEKS